MTRKTAVSQADLKRMAVVAKAHGVTVECKVEGVTYRVSPFHADTASKQEDPNPWDTVLDAPPEPIQPPFDHREQFAMERLVALGEGVAVHSCTLRGFGPHSQNKLLERGYFEVTHKPGNKFSDDEIYLTKKGMADWKALKRHRSKYPSL